MFRGPTLGGVTLSCRHEAAVSPTPGPAAPGVGMSRCPAGLHPTSWLHREQAFTLTLQSEAAPRPCAGHLG